MSNIVTVFGDVIVIGKKESSTGGTVAVRLEQRCDTTYPPGTRPQFALQGALAPATDLERVITSRRKTTQRFSLEEAAKLRIGQVMPGHLIRVLSDKPTYAGQSPAYEGGYSRSFWSPEYGEDQDERSK